MTVTENLPPAKSLYLRSPSLLAHSPPFHAPSREIPRHFRSVQGHFVEQFSSLSFILVGFAMPAARWSTSKKGQHIPF